MKIANLLKIQSISDQTSNRIPTARVTKKELQDLGVTKIPSSKKIQKRIENLESKQAATVREKQELLKKQKTLNIIRQNFTALLSKQSSQIYPSQRDNVHL